MDGIETHRPVRAATGVLARLRRRPVATALVALLLAGAAVYAVRRPGVPAGAPPGGTAALPLVSVVVPGAAPVARTVAVTGTIAARRDLPIGAEGDAGRIAAVLVDIGDHVRRGQVLARLDTSTLRPEVERLTAAVEQARADAELAEAEYQRALGAGTSGAFSKEDTGRRHAAAVTAAAKVKVAVAQLDEGRAKLARAEIRAPVDGVILARSAEVGQIAGPASGMLFRLAEGGQVELRGAVSEQDLPQLRVGQPATVRLTGAANAFSGRIRLLGAIVDPQTRLGEVRIALDPDPALRPGSFARGEVELGSEARPVVPQTAVLSDGAGLYVVAVGEGDRVVRHRVRVSGTTERGVIVAEGLTGAERVVSTAGAFLREGEQVRTVQLAPKP